MRYNNTYFEFDVVEYRSLATVKVNGATPRALLGVNVVSIIMAW